MKNQKESDEYAPVPCSGFVHGLHHRKLCTAGRSQSSNLAGPAYSTDSEWRNQRWPPKPEDIVIITDKHIGSYDVVYTVPSDRWLVITDAEYYAYNNREADLLEALRGVETVKRHCVFLGSHYQHMNSCDGPFSSAVGLAFAPGSQVVFSNQQGTVGTYSYALTGYLIDV